MVANAKADRQHVSASALELENKKASSGQGILSRIFETAATVRLQVGVKLVHER